MQPLCKIVIQLLHQQTRLPLPQLVPSAHLEQDLGLDSLEVVDLVLALESRLGIQISDDELDQFQTLSDVIRSVEKASQVRQKRFFPPKAS